MKDYSAHFRELVESQLPASSRILMPEGSQDMVLLTTWRLACDPFRRAKRSRMIRIVISQEALEDHCGGTDGVRLASDQHLASWLQRQLKGFDPNHDAPLGVEPAPVTWLVGTLDLNG